MTVERRAISFGMPVRDVVRLWQEEAGAILGDIAALEPVGEMAWAWRLDDTETGRVAFMDSGPGRGEAELEVNRTDGSAGDRLMSIVDGLGELLEGRGIDSPVVALDPDRGEAPDEATDPDQPL